VIANELTKKEKAMLLKAKPNEGIVLGAAMLVLAVGYWWLSANNQYELNCGQFSSGLRSAEAELKAVADVKTREKLFLAYHSWRDEMGVMLEYFGLAYKYFSVAVAALQTAESSYMRRRFMQDFSALLPIVGRAIAVEAAITGYTAYMYRTEGGFRGYASVLSETHANYNKLQQSTVCQAPGSLLPISFESSLKLLTLSICASLLVLMAMAALMYRLTDYLIRHNLIQLNCGAVIGAYLQAPAQPLGADAKRLYDSYEGRFSITDQAQSALCCPITHALMQDPVKLTYKQGDRIYTHRYEHSALSGYWQRLSSNVAAFVTGEGLRNPLDNTPLNRVTDLRIEHDLAWQKQIVERLTAMQNPERSTTRPGTQNAARLRIARAGQGVANSPVT
jgi:hypothetical protein